MPYIGDHPKLADLTPLEALKLLERAVQEKGDDYQDPDSMDAGCRYFDPETGAPSCIVGHVLAYRGFGYEDFPEVPGYVVIDPRLGLLRQQGASVFYLFRYQGPVAEILQAAQSEQDSGYPWGTALDAAKRKAQELEDARG